MLSKSELSSEARTTSFLLLCAFMLGGCHCSSMAGDSVSEEIRDRILSANGREIITIRDESICASSVLAALYRDRNYRAFWSANRGLLPQADSLVGAIEEADREGLRPGDYHLSSLAAMMVDFQQHREDRGSPSPRVSPILILC